MKPIFAHVTVPVDGSPASEHGIMFALEIAREGGYISFCSVVDPMLACAPSAQGLAIDVAPMLAILDEDAALFCRNAEAQSRKAGIVCDTRVLHGSCAQAIQSFAMENGSDAIVIGTHGRTGLQRSMLGSVTEGIVRSASVPVVCVHENDEMRTGPLVVAMDSSPAAQAALDVAVAIAAARGMSSMIVYVGNFRPPGDATESLLERAKQRVCDRGIAARIVLRQGKTADELIAAADEDDSCMIVVGTHGRSALARFVLGSVAAAVVEHAHIPVVTVGSAA